MGRTVPLWALSLLVAAATGKDSGAHRDTTHGGHGLGHGTATRSDSGRSLLPASEQADGDVDVGLLEAAEDGIAARGLQAGLAPWSAQSHLAVQQEYRRLSLPMLACRSRFISALREAGPEAEHVANAAMEAGRAFLDRVVEDALADIPLASVETDSEIDAIQASLAAGERYPAGDILEARWRRAVRLSRSPPDDGVLEARAKVRSSARSLCRVIGQELNEGLGGGARRVAVVPAAAKATVARLWKCLQHRLLPRYLRTAAPEHGAER